MRTDTLLAVVLQGGSLLGPFRPDSRRLDDLPPGRYHLKVFSAGGTVWRQEIALRRDTLLFLDGTKAEFRPSRADERFGSLFPVSMESEPSKQNISPSRFTQWPGAATGFNGISGRLTDESGEPLIGASVLVSQGGIAVGGVLTDIEGNYRIFLPPGWYDLSFQYTGFNTVEAHGVYVAGDGLVAVNQQLESGTMLHEVVVTAYKVPLIQQDMTSAGKTIISERIQHSSIRNLNALSGNLAGATETDKLNIKGSRSAFPYNEDANDDAFPAGEPALRSRFRDYAYWQPNLITDSNGEAWFRVTFPDNITGWNTYTLAMDRKKRAGVTTRNVRAYKPLTAKLSLPRFAVAGDRFDAAGLTSNFSGDSAEVHTAFRLDGQLLRQNRARIGEGLTEFAAVSVPEADSLFLSYEMKSPKISDGEQRGIAVLPVGVSETAGQFLMFERDTALTLSFDPAFGPIIVQAMDNTLDMLAEDIDFLRNYPYGCNEQTAGRLLALLAEKKLSALPRKQAAVNAKSRTKSVALLEKEIKTCLIRLRNAQLADGSWGWWAGGAPNAWMTIYVLRALRNAQEDGYACPGCEKGLIWLRREVGGLPLTEQGEALLLLRESDVQFDCTPYLTRLDTLPRRTLHERLSHWRLQQHCGRPLPVDTLLGVLTSTTTGGLYCGEESAHWYNRRAANTLLAYDIARAAGWEHLTRRIRHYWLESRATAQRRNTIETAQILQRVLPELLSQTDTLRANRLEINGVPVSDFPYKWVSPAGATAVTLVKSGNSPLFVNAYQQWQNPAPEPRSDLFEVESWLEQGGRRVDSLRRGEAAELVLRVLVRRSAEYALLEAPVPAGCSYGEKTRSIRPEAHREYFRDRTAIFFEFLPAGRYECRVPLEPRFTGRFTLNPARMEQMYFPVFYGRNAVNVVNVY
ncbi:MAG: carboxypeptidase regulatory-like domain-containing protein [Thermoanaerobaculia bacterium]|nr:carboxypeptidase regulatory-like domain-containing protein [Thermoanaerobaculia bacterium]